MSRTWIQTLNTHSAVKYRSAHSNLDRVARVYLVAVEQVFQELGVPPQSSLVKQLARVIFTIVGHRVASYTGTKIGKEQQACFHHGSGLRPRSLRLAMGQERDMAAQSGYKTTHTMFPTHTMITETKHCPTGFTLICLQAGR